MRPSWGTSLPRDTWQFGEVFKVAGGLHFFFNVKCSSFIFLLQQVSTNLVTSNTTNLSSHRVRSPESPSWGPNQGIGRVFRPLPRLSGGIWALPLPASGGCWLALVCSRVTLRSASVVTLPSALLPMIKCPSISFLSGHV